MRVTSEKETTFVLKRLGLVVALALILTSLPTRGAELIQLNTSVRALGMGNAFLGLARDSEALFYNPAGLVRADGYNLRVIGVRAGLDGADSLTLAKDILSAPDLTTAVANSYGESIWVGGGAETIFTMPYFGFGVYDSLSASFGIGNPVSPRIDLAALNDFGYAMSFAYPVLPTLHFGLGLKYVRRFGTVQSFSGASFASINTSAIEAAAKAESRGYAADMGFNLTVPGPIAPVISFVWRDMGQTKFEATNPNNQPAPVQRDEMAAGVALNIDAALVSITPAFDFRYLNREDVQFGRKLHFGVEISLPLLDIRGGFNQGYYTAGAGIDLGLFQIDAATYGVELGESPGQKEDRRYMVQLSIELGIGGSASWFSGGSSSKSGSGAGSAVGRRRLKQRR